MSRLAATFQRLSGRNEGALVAFVTAGDPDLDTSYQVVASLCRAGVDVIELGVPFSDPTADGPAIQRSAARSLAAGTTPADCLALVRRLRSDGCEQPVVLFGYYNPFLQYGLDRLAADAKAAGADGFLVVDLPSDEAGPMHAALRANDLDLIALVTPTSTPARIAAARAIASGFVYYVSRTGVTGARLEDVAGVNARLASLQAEISLPVCVGFGISQPAEVATLGRQAHGVVVGSALVTLVERLGRGEVALADIEAYARSLKAPLVAAATPA